MSTEARGLRVSDVTDGEAQAELNRLVDDPRFHATDRQKSILSYLAGRYLTGCAESVKAYAIALDVLGRSSDFDPSIDPIVRIEISRLRTALLNYYEAFGSKATVVIHLPRGRYVAEFRRGFIGDEAGDECDETYGHDAVEVGPAPVVKDGGRSRWRFAGAAAITVMVVVACGAIYFLTAFAVVTERPSVAIRLAASSGEVQAEAKQAREKLLTALTQFQTLRVAPGSNSSASYQIDMTYYADEDDRTVWWQIIDVADDDLLQSGVERVDVSGRAPSAAMDELVSGLARRFASTRGVINTIEIVGAEPNALGNACVIRAEYQLDENGSRSIADAERCLERTLAKTPGDSDAAATLARVLLAKHAGASTPELKARALTLASRAASLSPLSDRAQMALMMAQFYDGRTDVAISTGNKALALNPNNPEVSARLSLLLFTVGFWDAAASLAQDAGRAVDATPRDALLVLALDAYRKGRWSDASLFAEQINGGGLLVKAVRTAALGQLESDQAPARLVELKAEIPDVENTFHDQMMARKLVPSLSASVEDGLRKAGAAIPFRAIANAR